MAKFKVGDKIIRLEQWIDQSFPSITEIHEVTESYSGKITVKKYPRMGLYWNEDRFKLYEEPEMNQTKKPHVHAECIKAWADGAEIQYMDSTGKWVDRPKPIWDIGSEYRIKPETKPDVVLYATADVRGNVSHSRLILYQVDNLKLTFDGETGKLKKAEVIG